jgi:hypothetical protein
LIALIGVAGLDIAAKSQSASRARMMYQAQRTGFGRGRSLGFPKIM